MCSVDFCTLLHEKPTKTDEVLNRLDNFIVLSSYPSLLKYF